MRRIVPLSQEHVPELLRFEQENRAYFAAHIEDRGDEYFRQFAQRHREMLEDQERGRGFFHVILGEQGQILGRINLRNIIGTEADLGYRVGEDAAGQGIATWAVGEICCLAAQQYGIRALAAGVAEQNIGSQKVLERNGFIYAAETSWGEVSGRIYRRELRGRGAPAQREAGQCRGEELSPYSTDQCE